MGLDDAAVANALSSIPADDVEIWPWQQNTVDAFYYVSTQWRWAQFGGGGGAVISQMVGIDYAAADVAWRLGGITLTPDEFAAVREMEAEVLRGLAKNG